MVLEWLWGDTPCARAEKPQQDGKCWRSNYVVLEWLWGDTSHPRAKEKPQQDGRRGKINFRIKPHSHQRHSEGSNKCRTHQDPETPQRLRQNCVWMSSVELRDSSKLPQGCGRLGSSGLGMVQALLEVEAVNSTTEPPELTQDWGNRLSEGTNRTCVHQDPGERSTDPTRDWPSLANECPGVSGRGVACQWPARRLGARRVAVPFWRSSTISALPPP